METDIRKEMENIFMLYTLVVRKKIVRKKNRPKRADNETLNCLK